jgi:hypothetical protein
MARKRVVIEKTISRLGGFLGFCGREIRTLKEDRSRERERERRREIRSTKERREVAEGISEQPASRFTGLPVSDGCSIACSGSVTTSEQAKQLIYHGIIIYKYRLVFIYELYMYAYL